MINTNIILNLDFIKEKLSTLEYLERDRIYCRHNMMHFLSVARICYILCLENKINIDRDLVYSAAILHDLGRIEEIKSGIRHEIASCDVAKVALEYTNFSLDDKMLILSAIKNHRTKSDEITFESLFYKADKLSRNCFDCISSDVCNWSSEKKNHKITY
ncbi:HD domain-containing protein [Peptoniphilus mikwangii]|uniref:HD domain-containing protein n=1 Tax=Peptoniphilus mikwangii TaxID=1354300 RepID=UPI000400B6EA|nr:HD domain-containing protein [Peptoniphilus mikwangii]